MIWRDDDLGVDTDGALLATFERVDDVFQQYAAPHTAAIIARGLTAASPLVRCLRRRHVIPQLHGWDHDDLTASAAARAALPDAAALLADLFGTPPTVLYPPWNRSSPAVEAAAQALGLTVSTEKVSLDQYLRFHGQVREDTVNFHYWSASEALKIPAALQLWAFGAPPMKITDYCPRAAPFDSYITRIGTGLVGVEVGVDVGAHAEALLRYCPIAHLTLVDPWPKDYAYGFCEGRLVTQGFRARFTMQRQRSAAAAVLFDAETLDFLYIDQEHDGDVVAEDLRLWWPALRIGGILGYRNYVPRPIPLSEAIDRFVKALDGAAEPHVEAGEIILLKRR